MQLFLNHTFKYEAEQIGLLFFPKHEELTLKSEIFEENGETKALCIMEYEGHTAAAERRAVCAFSDRRICGQATYGGDLIHAFSPNLSSILRSTASSVTAR